jgi:hypothetical protein
VIIERIAPAGPGVEEERAHVLAGERFGFGFVLPGERPEALLPRVFDEVVRCLLKGTPAAQLVGIAAYSRSGSRSVTVLSIDPSPSWLMISTASDLPWTSSLL